MKKYILLFITLFLFLFIGLQHERIFSSIFLSLGNITGNVGWYAHVTDTHLSRVALYNTIMAGTGEKRPSLESLSGSGGDMIDMRIYESLGDIIAFPILSTHTGNLSEDEKMSLTEAMSAYREALERGGNTRIADKYRLITDLLGANTLPSSPAASLGTGASYTAGDPNQYSYSSSSTLTEGERAELSYTLEDLRRIEANRSDVTDFYGNHSLGALESEIHSLYEQLSESTGSEKRDW